MADLKKHQPFDTWLFEPQSLSADEQAALRGHLAECDACRLLSEAWNAIEDQLEMPSMIAPAPGFTERWRIRQAHESARRIQRRTWIVLVIMIGSAIALAPYLVTPYLESLKEPAQLGIGLLRSFSEALAFVSSIRNLFVVITHALGKVPPWWWLANSAMVSALGALWTGLIYRLAHFKVQNGGF